jgi:glutamate/tyrosine decarboxylase-like PLP-dependent enzyme
MISSKQKRKDEQPLREARRINGEARNLINRRLRGQTSPDDRQKMIALQTELRMIGIALKVECTRINSQMQQKTQSRAATAAYQRTSAMMARAAQANRTF